MSGLSDTSAFEAFNRMSEKIEQDERKVMAQAEITEALSGDTLETEFMKLEAGTSSPDVDDRLLALKGQMGLLPPGMTTPTEPRQLMSGSGPDSASGGDGETGGGVTEAELISEFDKLGDDRN